MFFTGVTVPQIAAHNLDLAQAQPPSILIHAIGNSDDLRSRVGGQLAYPFLGSGPAFDNNLAEMRLHAIGDYSDLNCRW